MEKLDIDVEESKINLLEKAIKLNNLNLLSILNPNSFIVDSNPQEFSKEWQFLKAYNSFTLENAIHYNQISGFLFKFLGNQTIRIIHQFIQNHKNAGFIFINAIQTYNIPRALELINQNTWLNVTTHHESGKIIWHGINSALSHSCFHNHKELVIALINNGASVNPPQHDSYHHPLFAAIEGNALEIVEILIKAGSNVNHEENNSSPLLLAIKLGYFPIVQLLIQAGAKVNYRNFLTSPLIEVVKKNNILMVRMLIEAGAEVNLPNYYSTSALLEAIKHNNSFIIDILIKAGSNVNQLRHNTSPLLEAIKQNNITIVSLLLKEGVFIQAIFNTSPLLTAIAEHNLIIISLLIQHGADVNEVVNNKLPLIEAIKIKNAPIINLLLESGAEINKIINNNSPLLEAIRFNHKAIVDLLIQHGAKVNLKYPNGITPLALAIKGQNIEIVKTLLYANADLFHNFLQNIPELGLIGSINPHTIFSIPTNHETTEFLRYIFHYMHPLQQKIDIKTISIIKDINMCIQHSAIIKKHNLCETFMIEEQTAIKLLEVIEAKIISHKNNNPFPIISFIEKIFLPSKNNLYNHTHDLALLKEIRLIINEFSDFQKIALKDLQNTSEQNLTHLTHVERLKQNSSAEMQRSI
ncbi:Ankyrin repeat protein [Rickettsiales bacterium Ac37b]|nr:Ankyrin repeat protein [Rickettsiales bacterium Ac37b]